jgi:hypothetical protein
MHFAPCPCNGGLAGSLSVPGVAGSQAFTPVAGSVAPPPAGVAGSFPPPPAGPAGAPGPAPAGMVAPPPVGIAGNPAAAGRGVPPAAGMPMMGAAGMPAMGAAGMMAPAAGSGSTDTGVDPAELEMLRQTCVDEINRYRAMLPSIKPLKRGTPDQEACSDKGAQMDGDSGQAHGSARAGLCRSVGLSAEDTCPGWGVGGFSGNATLADALKSCLKAMWDEGEPPVSRQMCVQDYQGCFLKYGHYLNMSDPSLGSVVCSFYKMKNGSYWMNQDFSF